MHEVPFPEYPLLQVQTKEPTVLLQAALTSQGLPRHSFTSKLK